MKIDRNRAIPGCPTPGRHPESFYRTPRWAIDALLDREAFPGVVWEPACGDGAIADALIARGATVIATDLYDRGYGAGGVDFLDPGGYLVPLDRDRFDHLVTNPPFHARLPEKFLHRALQVVTGKVALLVRTLWLEGVGRGRTVFGGATPLRAVYVFSERVDIARADYQHRSNGRGGMASFSWYVWERGYVGEPVLRWIS